MKYVDQVKLRDQRVFIRADLNVPLSEKGEIADDTRIKAVLPTLNYVLEQGGKVILASHLGRPEKGFEEKFSLKPIARRLEQLLQRKVTMAPDCIGDEVSRLVSELKNGEILLLENLRFHAEEEKNDISFASKLARLCDVYVNDAFATAHRVHASTVGITEFCKEKVGGFTIKQELEYFSKAFEQAEQPLLVIFGGSKVSTKISAVENVAQAANKLVIGGAMANTFLAAMGYDIGKSLYEEEEVENALAIKAYVEEQDCELLLPVDVVVATELKPGIETAVVPVSAIPPDSMALDIGPQTIELYTKAIADARTIIWNGPLGAFEVKGFEQGTFAIIDALTRSTALRVVGGGDTDYALQQCNALSKMSYVSTAGGAFLALLEGETLPAVEALEGAV